MRVVPALALLAAVGLAGCEASTGPAAELSGSSPVVSGRTTSSPASTSVPRARARAALPLPETPTLRPVRRLAAEIDQAERTIADPASANDAIRAAGRFQQLASRILAGAGAGERRRVMSTLDGRAAAVLRANIDAATGLGSLTAPEPKLPKGWRIVAPLPAHRLMRLYRAAQRHTGVPWQYLAAINFVETKMGRVVGPSTAGAQGPMQFMPATWREYGAGGDIHDPHDAIPAAARLLAANGAPRDMAGALRAYNDSSYYVHAVTAYAHVMKRWPRAFRGYWGWRVLYKTVKGTYVLPVGYPKTPAVRLPAG